MKKIFTSNIIIIKDNKYLLQLRNGSKAKIKENNKWGLFGGHCKPSEKSKECVCRELKEETNLKIQKPKFEFYIFVKKYHAKVSIFSKKIKKMKNFKLNEGANYGFFSKQEILNINKSNNKKLEISNITRKIFKTFFLKNSPNQ